jgi:hypothetical protein
MRPIRSFLILLIAAPLAAQTALVADATVRSTAGGSVIAALKQGTTVTVGAARDGEVFVTFTGWVDGSKLGGAKDSFPAQLLGPIAMRLRSAPSMKGAILGEVRPGAGLHTMSRQSTWVNVSRGGWVNSTSLPRGSAKSASAAKAAPTVKPTPKQAVPVRKMPAKPAAAAPRPATPQAAPEPSVDSPAVIESVPDGAMRVVRTSVARSSPNGGVQGQIAAGTVVVPLARLRGWVRVRAEMWVPERDVVPADALFGATLSAADLRADPEGTRGKTVRWEVQVLALQYADPLRHELALDEPYYLAKGPGAEDQLLYLAIPPSLLTEAKSIQSLTRLLITARVRTGRSQPVGIPILDILSLARQ